MTAALIERLEKAEAGSRELDADLFRHFGAPLPTEFAGYGVELVWQEDGSATMPVGDLQVRYDPPAYTTCVTAALALAERVLPGWSVMSIGEELAGKWGVLLVERGGGPLCTQALGPCPALAMCAAILKARTAASPSSVGMSEANAQKTSPGTAEVES